ncbi:hypothetical protein ACIRRA_42300 [Nocardia sp. NPDC101769]
MAVPIGSGRSVDEGVLDWLVLIDDQIKELSLDPPTGLCPSVLVE